MQEQVLYFVFDGVPWEARFNGSIQGPKAWFCECWIGRRVIFSRYLLTAIRKMKKATEKMFA